MTRIFLVGFMASGKTTLGRALARSLGLTFIDLDLYIEGRFHRTIAQLFDERGESGFRELERSMLHEVCEMENVIIASGGGTPCFFDNMDYMNACGTCVWLKVPPEVIRTRLLINRQKRPLVSSMPEEELPGYIAAALARREPFYSRAKFVFDGSMLEDRTQIGQSVDRFRKEVLGVCCRETDAEGE